MASVASKSDDEEEQPGECETALTNGAPGSTQSDSQQQERQKRQMMVASTTPNTTKDPTVRTTMLCQPPRDSDTLSVHSYLCPKMSDASTITDVFSSSFEDDYGVGRRGGSVISSAVGLAVCRRSRACCIVLYVWISLFLLGCLVAIVLVVTRIVLPYTRTVYFRDALCTPKENATFSPDVSCSCGRSCQTVYPCVTIVVNFMDTESVRHEAILYDSEGRINKQCSYFPPCKSSRVSNMHAVHEYAQRYGVVGQRFSCLYNPDNHKEVIRIRRFHLNHVIHGLVWSSLVFLSAVVLLICAARKKQCHFL